MRSHMYSICVYEDAGIFLEEAESFQGNFGIN